MAAQGGGGAYVGLSGGEHGNSSMIVEGASSVSDNTALQVSWPAAELLTALGGGQTVAETVCALGACTAP